MSGVAIFDFDGTLCATHEAIRHCLQGVFTLRGVRAPDPALLEDVMRSGVGLADGIHRLRGGGPTKAPDLGDWVNDYRRLYNGTEGLARTRLFPAAEATLRELRRNGCRCVVVSNKGEESIHRALVGFGIADCVDLVVGDRPGLPKKPDPASYATIIAPAFPNCPAAATMMVGDTVADLAYGRAIGVRLAWARYGYGEEGACRALQPDYILEQLSDLPRLIAR